MSFYSLFPFLGSLFALFLGSLVFIKQKKSPVNRAFSRCSFLTFIWLFFYACLYSAKTETNALFCIKIGYTAVILMPVAFYHLTYSLLNLKSHKKILIFAYSISFLFVYFLHRSDYFITGLFRYFGDIILKLEFYILFIWRLFLLLLLVVILLFLSIGGK